MTQPVYHKKYAVNLIESERGWGSKVDETRLFDTLEEAEEFVEEFNSKNTAETVPDWYMYAEKPKAKFVEAEEEKEEELPSTISTKMYLHGCKESNAGKADELGLSGEAADNFRYALHEVEFDVEVNTATGNCEIVAVDGHKLQREE